MFNIHFKGQYSNWVIQLSKFQIISWYKENLDIGFNFYLKSNGRDVRLRPHVAD